MNSETANQDTFRPRQHPLGCFFEPKSVAVIGAVDDPGTVGRTVLWNLIRNPFGGTVFPVHPRRSSVLGVWAYPNIAAVPEQVDLAVIVTPAKTVPGIVRECVDAGVKAAIIISAGFKEVGPEGAELERQVLAEARRGSLRIIGPNCYGMVTPVSGLNVTFARVMALRGNIGFISQSGALCATVLDWSLQGQIGFSAFVSVGSMCDVGWGDLIDYLGHDPNTRSILLYMESIGDARKFLSAAREVALTKPIIVLKPGRTGAAAKAAASHTGSLTGSDEVLDAAFRRAGVLRVNDMSELFSMAELLARQPRPAGPRLAIVSNAGGPAVLATDALIANGGQIAELAGDTMQQLNAFLPAAWSHNNPVDVLGDAPPERFAKAFEIVAKDPNTDGVLAVMAAQGLASPTKAAEQLRAYAHIEGKPVLASWMGGADVAPGDEILKNAGVATFPYSDMAARAFVYMWRYSYNLRALYETPLIPQREADSDAAAAGEIIRGARESGRTLLTEYESKRLLRAYGIPTVETRVAASEDEAVAAAGEIGFPVVLKLHSLTITHKTDVGGVKLNLRSPEDVRAAYSSIESSVREKAGPGHFQGVTVQPMIKAEGYELIAGSSIDSQFGPVLLFGEGGQLVEVAKDRALALPPLNTTLARRMMEQTRIYTALKGVRGRKPVDLAALEELMVRFSQLVIEQRWIREIDINPLVASSEALLALDARVVLHGPEVRREDLPKLAIRPYPTRYVSPWTMKDGTEILIRPIRPEDEPLVVKFHETVSERSVYNRYLQALQFTERVAHERLTRICFIDYDREIALVAERQNPHSIVGIGRLKKVQGTNEGDVAVLVSDGFHGHGLGTELTRRIIQVAADEGLSRVRGDILPENAFARIAKNLGFKLSEAGVDGAAVAVLDLQVPA